MPRKGKRSAALKQRWQKFGESQQSVPAEQLVSSPPHSNREVNVPQPSHANVTRVLASRSQMHKKYADSKNSQCTCNSATFLAFLHELKHLQSADLDLVLDRGHAMYALTLSQLIADGRHVHTHLNTEEIPEVVLGYRQTETNKADELSVDENLAHADSNADVTTDLNPMSSVTQAESETSVPSCSVTQSTVCVDSTPDVNELLHVTTSEGPVEYPTSDTTKHDNEHVPDLSKYSRQEKRRLKKRALAMGKKKVTQAETATSLPSCSVTVGSDADITVSHMREQDRETMSSITQAEVETSLPSCSVTECTPCADNTQDTNELMHVSSSEGTVAYPTLDTPQHHSQHMPDLSKLTKQQRLKVKNRLMAMENKIASQVEKNRRIEIQKMEKNRKEREKYTKDQFCTKQKKSRQCYRQNVEYRKRKMSYITTRYKQDSSFQQRQTLYIRKHYSQDIGFQQKQRTYVTKRYSQDPGFQQKQRTYVTKRYSQDIGFQQKQRTYVTKRYSQDPGFQQKQRTYVTKRYSQDPGFQQKQRTYVTKRYSQDPGFQQKQRTYVTKRYSQDIGFQQKQRTYITKRYSQDIGFQQKQRTYVTKRYSQDPGFQQKQRTYVTKRYSQDPGFQQKQRTYITKRYSQDPGFQQKQRTYITKRYSQDPGFQQKQRTYVTKRYGQDIGFQQKQRTYITKRYSQDIGFQQKQRTYITKRYSQDPGFEQKQRTYVTKRYSQDPGFQQKQRTYVTKRYSQDPGFQQKQRTYVTKRYSQDPGFQQRKRSKLKYCYQSNAHFRQTRKSYMTNRYANDCAFRSKQKETMRRLMRNKYRAFRMSNNVRCALKIRRKPETPEFEAMCLADFAATCRILYGKQARGKNAIPLLNQMGFVQKRTNEKPAVIKYHIVSEEKFPEQFHRTLLKLYLPHRSEGQLKSVHFPTYKSFHECACVQPPDLDHLVRVAHIVKLNRDKYEKHREDIESAISEYEQNGIIRNEWCNLAPESELERLECISELDARQNDDDNVQENVPDLSMGSDARPDVAIMRD
ncbi:hypothetical protein ABVT39_020016 [Epinephelus coioides]